LEGGRSEKGRGEERKEGERGPRSAPSQDKFLAMLMDKQQMPRTPFDGQIVF